MSTTTPTPPAPQASSPAATGESVGSRVLRALLTQRTVLIVVLLVAVLVTFVVMDAGGYLTGPYDGDTLAAALINLVPLAMLALAEMLVIVSGRGGIDLSIGSTVSLTGMIFGFAYQSWGLPLLPAILVAMVAGGLCGAINGFLIAYLGFPALIATLATYYGYASIALVINDQKPVTGDDIAGLYSSAAQSVELPLIGANLPDIPVGVFYFLLPTVVVVYLVMARTAYGRRLFATGTNDVAGHFAGIDVRDTRFKAYVLAGVIAGLVAVVTTAQFASARPDAGTSGNGMALPAITIAVLGGVAITGGIARVAGVVLAGLLVVWLNAGIPLAIEGNDGPQFQLLALGAVLIFAALLNGLTTRRYGGTR
ncbi:ABC transporter permease [Nakamurella deserti]|uniref:ABC transporter permease n=1 Tax=Nakamurella deserti TaxID=2164074 RepID=UPI000DBE7557|nr:ABC transporter permease [Nakamurella deserti]